MIIPVKRARLFLLEEDVSSALKLIQKKGLMMVTKSDEAHTLDTQEEEKRLIKIETAIKHLESFKGKKGFFEYHEVSHSLFESINEENLDFLESVLESKVSLAKLEEAYEQLDKEIKSLTIFHPLSLDLNQMKQTTYINFYSGIVHENNHLDFEAFLKEHHIPYEKLDQDERGIAYVFALLRDDIETYLNDIYRFDFKEVILPLQDQTIDTYLMDLTNQRASLKQDKEQLIKRISNDAKEIKRLYLLYDQTLSLKKRKQTPFLKTKETILIEGWVRVDEEAYLRKLLKGFSFELELFDSKEEPPTALKNNTFVANFETITDSYNIPNHKEIDPNPLMSIWYFMIFGIMMGDMGYGLVMLLFFGLFLKLKKPKGAFKQLLTVFYYCGYSTIFFGLLFGSLFGFSVDLGALVGKLFNQTWTTTLISPMNNPLEMLIVSLGIGILHIISGLVMKVILSFKLKDPLSALADGFSWIFILIGIVFVALNMALKNALFMYIGLSLVGLGVLLILVLSGREKKNILLKITSGLGGLYGATNYLSDVLSYSRVLALALSSAVIGFTFNLLAGMMHGSIIGILFAVVIYIVGHMFNFAMSMLSAYIHDSRLQYIEFYNKFYIGEGYQYEPLQISLKYLDNIGGNE